MLPVKASFGGNHASCCLDSRCRVSGLALAAGLIIVALSLAALALAVGYLVGVKRRRAAAAAAAAEAEAHKKAGRPAALQGDEVGPLPRSPDMFDDTAGGLSVAHFSNDAMIISARARARHRRSTSEPPLAAVSGSLAPAGYVSVRSIPALSAAGGHHRASEGNGQ
eukprot:scaffold647858_cov43-Prasinocladus_malaysianus.AAC.1